MDGTRGRKVGEAVVGEGYWGPNLIRNVLACPETSLEWVCDIDVDRAHRVLGEGTTTKVTGSLDDVLSDPAVEAVAIATPARTHVDVARPALESGRYFLIDTATT